MICNGLWLAEQLPVKALQLSPIWRCNILQKYFAFFSKKCLQKTDLDKDENLINTPYATFDLRKGLAGEQLHNPEDLITKITACSPGEEGKQIWLDALSLFFCKDQKLIDYVQETVGMAAIGKVYQEHMIIAYGGGRMKQTGTR